MPELTAFEAPDWGLIERQAGQEASNILWFLRAMLTQEAQRREREMDEKAPEYRQDRTAMMAVYS